MSDSDHTEGRKGEQSAEYQMTLSLNVLNHLGLGLYSNVPAVLSEAVANAWDADATVVNVDIFPDEEMITITDDGNGMSKEDVNKRYLHVGYKRREEQGSKSEKFGRDVMGRKGIGKLSLFSIAKTVEVFTTDGDEKNSFQMNVDDIREAIGEEEGSSDKEGRGSYEPKVIDSFPDDVASEDSDSGTRIVLKDLKKEVYQADKALRKRLARRFSIIGEGENFRVSVNGSEVEITDRDYFHKLEYLWTFGDGTEYGGDDRTYEDYCNKLEEAPFSRDKTTSDSYTIRGWIGTVVKPKDLVENYGAEGSDDLNKITLLIRGKMAKENLLEDFNDSRFYTKYLVGEIRADFLDTDEKDDIATSNREDVFKQDPRYQDLLNKLEDELDNIKRRWSQLRRDKGAEKAREEVPEIDEWYDRLESEDKKKQAKKLFGKINQITTDSEEERRQLFKYGVLAFERMRYKKNLSTLDDLDPSDIESLDDIFVDLNDIEASLYYQIVKQRIEVIEELEEAIGEDYKEKVLQRHLFNNLWLLDPSWERATGSEYKESSIASDFSDDLPDKLTGSEKRGRIDIKYRMTTGRHVIIELKRPGRKVTTPELMEQGGKYRRTLKKILKNRNRGHEPVEVVFVIGDEPKDWYDEDSRKEKQDSLSSQSMRVLQYETLLDEAQDSYEQYLNKQKEVGELSEIIDKIETGDMV